MKKFKRLAFGRLVALTAVMVSPTGLARVGGEVFSLKISAIQENVRVGSEIRLKTILTNESGHDIVFYERNRWCDYALQVRNSRGELAPETEDKRNLECDEALVVGRYVVVKLRPGEHHEDEMYVDQVYAITQPDNYTFQVAREIPKELGKGTAKSNIITIGVSANAG